ncbi:hypothetical protein AB3Y40_16235 [Yoonia sp. R2331]|uniref:hypothetical protein n=1 Tax=Yoonia sp. R2331 TaxID=3237238 RepID=UPI0034E57CDE
MFRVMRVMNMNATGGVQGAFLERAVRKQKQAVEASKALPPEEPEPLKTQEESPLDRAKSNLRYLLGIGPVRKH